LSQDLVVLASLSAQDLRRDFAYTAVDYSVPDIAGLTVSVERRQAEKRMGVLWPR
jgi:hypothetical protein